MSSSPPSPSSAFALGFRAGWQIGWSSSSTSPPPLPPLPSSTCSPPAPVLELTPSCARLFTRGAAQRATRARGKKRKRRSEGAVELDLGAKERRLREKQGVELYGSEWRKVREKEDYARMSFEDKVEEFGKVNWWPIVGVAEAGESNLID